MTFPFWRRYPVHLDMFWALTYCHNGKGAFGYLSLRG